MDNDLVYKLVNHGRGQLGKIGVLLCECHKLIDLCRIRFKTFQVSLSFLDGHLQRFLLLLIFSGQHIKPLFADFANRIGFIKFFDNAVQLRRPFLLPPHTLLQCLDSFSLPDL